MSVEIPGWPNPPWTEAEKAANVADAEQHDAGMAEAEQCETPGIWAGDVFIGRSRGVVGRFRRLRRSKNQIHWIAPRYGGLPKYDDDKSEMNGRYTIVLFEAKPYEAHVCRGAYTVREVLRRNRPRRCEVGDHSGADRHLVLVRGQFVVVWSVCSEHAAAVLDHDARNVDWRFIAMMHGESLPYGPSVR